MPFVGMILGFVTLMVLIMGAVALGVIRLVKGPEGQRESDITDKALQQLSVNLERMEQRIESLETILLDKERSK